jgi:hypothetical protein
MNRKSSFGSIAVFGAAVLFGPQLLEGTGSACSAVDTKLTGGINLTGGLISTSYVQTHNPNLPPWLGCALIYWELTLNLQSPK